MYNEAEKNYSAPDENGKAIKPLLWAQITSKISFCYAIDKIYTPKDIPTNFAIMKSTVTDHRANSEYHIPEELIEQFFQCETKSSLVRLSKSLLMKYYKRVGN